MKRRTACTCIRCIDCASLIYSNNGDRLVLIQLPLTVVMTILVTFIALPFVYVAKIEERDIRIQYVLYCRLYA